MLAILFGNKYSRKDRGISIIEILIVIFIVVIALVSLSGLAVFSLNNSSSLKNVSSANSLAEEAVEVTRSFRDGTNWDTDGLGVLAVGSGNPYYPHQSIALPVKWELLSGEETTNGFVRKIVFDRVSRDPATKNIESVYNFSNNDPNTRKVTVTVTWGSKKIEIVSYFTNWKP